MTQPTSSGRNGPTRITHKTLAATLAALGSHVGPVQAAPAEPVGAHVNLTDIVNELFDTGPATVSVADGTLQLLHRVSRKRLAGAVRAQDVGLQVHVPPRRADRRGAGRVAVGAGRPLVESSGTEGQA